MMSVWRFWGDQRGFTLLEAMVTVAVLAILVTIGVPSFQATIERNRVTTVANDLLYHLQLARSEAVKRNRPVILDSLNWGDNWQITSTDEDNDPVEIRVAQLPAGVTVTPVPNTTEVEFSAIGMVVSNIRPNFTVTVGSSTRYVCLIFSGAARVSTEPCD